MGNNFVFKITLRTPTYQEIEKESFHEARYKLLISLSKLQDFFLLFHRYQSEAKRQRERRLKLKEGISKVCEENKEAASLLRSFNRKEHGRPRIEYDHPELLSPIVKTSLNILNLICSFTVLMQQDYPPSTQSKEK